MIFYGFLMVRFKIPIPFYHKVFNISFHKIPHHESHKIQRGLPTPTRNRPLPLVET